MKKQLSKKSLELNASTVRALGDAQLTTVPGAGKTRVMGNCPSVDVCMKIGI